MYLCRTRPSIILTGLVAAAFASPANANLTVFDEGTEQPCTSVTTDIAHIVNGGCLIHIVGVGETRMVVGTAGGPVIVSTCEDEFEAAVDQAGEGYVYTVVMKEHTPGASCTRVPCDEPEPSHATLPWGIHIREAGPGDEYVHLRFCTRSESQAEGANGSPCELSIPTTMGSEPHQLILNALSGIGCSNFPAGTVAFFGLWETENGPFDPHGEIEIIH